MQTDIPATGSTLHRRVPLIRRQLFSGKQRRLLSRRLPVIALSQKSPGYFDHMVNLRCLTTLLCFSLLAHAVEATQQFTSLAEQPDKPRFQLRDRDWPDAEQTASICLWRNDALAAFSLTIDDNCAVNVPWWKEMITKHGLRPTWFLVTEDVAGPHPEAGGTWELWRGLVAAGCDVQSHSVTHLRHLGATWPGIAHEYAASQQAIDSNMPGHRCLAIAYPGGKDMALNDPAVAAKHYLAGRGVVGTPNCANRIWYLKTNAASRLSFDGGKVPSIGLNTLFNPASQYWRGWYVTIYHFVKAESQAEYEADFAKLQKLQAANDLWMGLFREVAQYGQERDTATLQVVERSAARLRLSLSDSMDDSLFDVPLTLKIRLPDGWQMVSAKQGTTSPAVRHLDHDGNRYALVEAVPDRGMLELDRITK
jgi:hypothetical protein